MVCDDANVKRGGLLLLLLRLPYFSLSDRRARSVSGRASDNEAALLSPLEMSFVDDDSTTSFQRSTRVRRSFSEFICLARWSRSRRLGSKDGGGDDDEDALMLYDR